MRDRRSSRVDGDGSGDHNRGLRRAVPALALLNVVRHRRRAGGTDVRRRVRGERRVVGARSEKIRVLREGDLENAEGNANIWESGRGAGAAEWAWGGSVRRSMRRAACAVAPEAGLQMGKMSQHSKRMHSVLIVAIFVHAALASPAAEHAVKRNPRPNSSTPTEAQRGAEQAGR